VARHFIIWRDSLIVTCVRAITQQLTESTLSAWPPPMTRWAFQDNKDSGVHMFLQLRPASISAELADYRAGRLPNQVNRSIAPGVRA
jgi:hypothetical protein